MDLEKNELHSLDSLPTVSKCSPEDQQFNDRITRYSKAKNTALLNRQYIREQLPQSNHVRKVSTQLRECGSYLVFHNYFTINKIDLAYASFCKKSLICPLCAIRRGSKMLAKYLDRFQEIIAENPSQRAYMVTLTVKDGDSLIERFNHLQNSVKALNKRRHRAHTDSETKKAHSAVWSYEVKRGKNSGSWHPHVHAIWLCEEKPDARKISEEWKNITKDSFIVDVTEIDQEEPITGFLEVFKYAVKFSSQSPEDTWECFERLSRRRLVGSFGLFRGLNSRDIDLTDDLENEYPFIEMFFRYSRGNYRFIGDSDDYNKSFNVT